MLKKYSSSSSTWNNWKANDDCGCAEMLLLEGIWKSLEGRSSVAALEVDASLVVLSRAGLSERGSDVYVGDRWTKNPPRWFMENKLPGWFLDVRGYRLCNEDGAVFGVIFFG